MRITDIVNQPWKTRAFSGYVHSHRCPTLLPDCPGRLIGSVSRSVKPLDHSSEFQGPRLTLLWQQVNSHFQVHTGSHAEANPYVWLYTCCLLFPCPNKTPLKRARGLDRRCQRCVTGAPQASYMSYHNKPRLEPQPTLVFAQAVKLEPHGLLRSNIIHLSHPYPTHGARPIACAMHSSKSSLWFVPGY